jgi:hypothetical protein
VSHIESYRATTSLQEFSENMGTISFKVDGTYPLDASLAGYPLSVIGHLGSSTLVGSNRDALVPHLGNLEQNGKKFKAHFSRG